MQKHVGEELHLTKVRDSDSECQVAKAQEQTSGATPRPRLGAAAAQGRRGPRGEPLQVQGQETQL